MAESRSLDVDEDEEQSQNDAGDTYASMVKCQHGKANVKYKNNWKNNIKALNDVFRDEDDQEMDQKEWKVVDMKALNDVFRDEDQEDPDQQQQDAAEGEGEKQEEEEEGEELHGEGFEDEAHYRFHRGRLAIRSHRSIEEDNQIDDVPACIKEVLCYAESMNVCERQISCRHLLETLKLLSESPDDVERLFQIIDTLSHDLEPCVVAELIEHVLPIARFCYEKEHLRYLIADRLVPLLLKFLMAPDPQVRGNTQECLRILRLQNLIDQEVVKREICPVIISLTFSTQSSPEYYSNAITLMTKMSPVLGQEATEEFLVPRIVSLSMDSVAQVRKMCVMNFGEFCSAVSTQVTENILLPYFIRSCYDSKWEVRKACAEVIMSVSCACRLETRKSVLAPVCAALLSDTNRSVRMAAFETLGPFITTFAEPSITGLAYNQHGQLVLTNWSGFEFRTTPKDDDRRPLDELCDELGSIIKEHNSSLSTVGMIDNEGGNNSDNSDGSSDDNGGVGSSSGTSISSSPVYEPICSSALQNRLLRKMSENKSKHSHQFYQYCADLGSILKAHNSSVISQINNNADGNDCLSDTNRDDHDENSSSSGNNNSTSSSALRDYERNSNDNSIVANKNYSISVNQFYKQASYELSTKETDASENDNYFNNNSNDSNKNDATNKMTAVVDLNDNEDSLQQYNTFLYWRDPLPVLDDLDIPVSISKFPVTLDEPFLSLSSPTSSSSLSSVCDDANVSKSSFVSCEEKSPSKEDSVQSNVENGDSSSANYTTSANSSDDNNCNRDSNSDTKKIPADDNSNSDSDSRKIPIVASKGNESNKEETSPIMEMLVMQMYHRLYSGFNNDITYRPIPVLPFSDYSTNIRQNIGLGRVPGVGLCRKKPCEKPRQNIVPQELIDHFVSLSDPVQGNCVDNRFLVYQIAYSLPAVAQTLGRENWPLLKNVYEKLASDKTWKVRRAVASSIHELAAIIGQDAATQDLIPVFNDIIKDLDEVRIGALKHLAMFLKTLRPAGRNSFLPKLSEFLMTDCDMNWRFREELAEQLLQMVGLFSATDTYTHLMPLAILLLLDKVAAVRQVALSLVTELVSWISSDTRLLHSILVELAEQFAHSTRWNRRQTFALLCSKLVSQNVLPEQTFAINVLPHLLDLSWDSVPNVRLAVARTLSTDIAHHSYFSDPQCPHYEVVMQTLQRLQEDRDRDVQYLAFSKPTSVSPPVSDDGQEST